MLAEAACTSLGGMSKTRSPHAHFIQHAASTCHAFFWRPHTQPPLLAYRTAKVGSVCTPENSQPVILEELCSMCLNDAPQHWVAKNPVQRAHLHPLIFQKLESRSCRSHKVMIAAIPATVKFLALA